MDMKIKNIDIIKIFIFVVYIDGNYFGKFWLEVILLLIICFIG